MLTLFNAVRIFLEASLRPLARQEQGVTIVEYAIMLALAAPNVQSAVIGVFGQAVTAMGAIP
jgi:Flp pilus assembly pilin Flp